MVDDDDSLVFVLIDEVESLTAARKASVSGSEPSDAVRVVNAVLTAIDGLRSRKNVLLLTTSNVSEAIDVAFVDRADIRAYIGPPAAKARYDILKSTMKELIRTGIAAPNVDFLSASQAQSLHHSLHAAVGGHALDIASLVIEGLGAFHRMESEASSAQLLSRVSTGKKVPSVIIPHLIYVHRGPGEEASLASGTTGAVGGVDTFLTCQGLVSIALWAAAAAADGMSGRALRKLPLQAHARFLRRAGVHPASVAVAFVHTIAEEAAGKVALTSY
jgi:hypothetical protein